ncbi:hypothetical protein OIV83_003093 [Microbotryomycetes sp. JL201]|nr:hypothetical protein OIV83_003093 [Microbotryomycetes sp. JL201]
MRARTVCLVASVLCIVGSPGVQAAWGRKDAAPAKPATPVDAAAPPLPAADPIDGSGFVEASILSGTANAPPVTSTHEPAFQGTEYTWGPYKVRPSEFKVEAYLAALVAAYVVASVIGQQANKRSARQWFNANLPALQREFAGVGFGDANKQFVNDGGDEYLTYATGRRAVHHAWIKLQTSASHDPISALYFALRKVADYNYDSGEGRITIDFKLNQPEGTPGANFCFAVVDRRLLRKIRERWDLATFTNTSETTGVDQSMIINSENGEVTRAMMSPETGLADAIKPGSEHLQYFESLVVTDMGPNKLDDEKPKLPEDDLHLILTLRVPPGGKAALTSFWLTLACNIADVLNKKEQFLPQIQVNKLKKRRQDVLQAALDEIKKSRQDEQLEKKEDAMAMKRKLEREREDVKVAAMSKADRIKYQEKKRLEEQKALQRKMAKTQIKRA